MSDHSTTPESGEPSSMRQANLIREIAYAIADSAPDGWIRVRFVDDVLHGESAPSTYASTQDGETKIPSSSQADSLAWQLREVMYEEGRGTWYTIEMEISRDGEVTTRFNYEDKPEFAPVPPSPLSFVEDHNHFPRDLEHRPAWLREILDTHGS